MYSLQLIGYSTLHEMHLLNVISGSLSAAFGPQILLSFESIDDCF